MAFNWRLTLLFMQDMSDNSDKLDQDKKTDKKVPLRYIYRLLHNPCSAYCINCDRFGKSYVIIICSSLISDMQ